MDPLVDLVYQPLEAWDADARGAFAAALAPRYQRVTVDALEDPRGEGERRFQIRINASTKDANIPFAAVIGPDQERSGPYGGMSFVVFPSKEQGRPAILGLVVGTNGLAPDEDILGRPGHARKVKAIASWLRDGGAPLAWAKQDPVRIDLPLPRAISRELEDWKPACKRYGQVLYAVFRPPLERSDAGDRLVSDALKAYLDLFFDERRIDLMKAQSQDAERVRRGWLRTTLPDTTDDRVARLLGSRKYAVLEGPPGTGKTELANRLLETRYGGHGRTIQFHPGTTYESFIGGLAPRTGGAMGFTFEPTPGHLMEAAAEAAENLARPYLLVVDEINRADLAKVLGEAIYLFEPGRHQREVALPYEYPVHGARLRLPENLHVLGTMNSADRSIAILDLAVRRRFAFETLWPQLAVVEKHGGKRMQRAFHDLLMVFLEHAIDFAPPGTACPSCPGPSPRASRPSTGLPTSAAWPGSPTWRACPGAWTWPPSSRPGWRPSHPGPPRGRGPSFAAVARSRPAYPSTGPHRVGAPSAPCCQMSS